MRVDARDPNTNHFLKTFPLGGGGETLYPSHRCGIMRFKIGEFSKMGKVSRKVLRNYDEMGLLKPCSVDMVTRYRYYDSGQLKQLNEINRYRRAGLTLDEILRIRNGEDPGPILEERIRTTRTEIASASERLRVLEQLMGGKDDMGYDVEIRDLPGIQTAYRKGRIDRYSDMTRFVMEFAGMCELSDPGLECTEDGYCFVIYDDLEYREEDIGLEYHQAVKHVGKGSDEIGFMDFEPVTAACVKHHGSYDQLGAAYEAIMSWLDVNDMELAGPPRECYIHGCWDVDTEEEYLTEIQFPVRHK
ncbi:MAG: MerR family transcriptional regulator [Thermoplasmata archaeon]|nr:MerR family transcriptional regulator [Thermoplasmata archaeon]